MRDAAEVTLGLTACADSISCTSRSSACPRHQLARSVWLPWCGSGACHCCGACASTCFAGPCTAQALSVAATANTVARKKILMLSLVEVWFFPP
jgi:hypothetical protein